MPISLSYMIKPLAGLISLAIVFTHISGIDARAENASSDENTITAADIFKKSDRSLREKVVPFPTGSLTDNEDFPSVIDDASTSSTVSKGAMEDRKYKTADHVLPIVPGFLVKTHRDGYPQLMLRGFDQRYLTVLLDGIPMNDIFSMNTDLSALEVMNTSTVLINRGVSSALYGTAGPLGIINISTLKPVEAITYLEAEYGLLDNYAINVCHGMPIKNFYYLISGTMLNSQGIKPSEILDSKERINWFNRLIPYYLYDNGGAPYTFNDVAIPAKYSYILDEGKWNHTNSRKYFVTARMGYNFSRNMETGITGTYYNHSGRANAYENNAYSDYRFPVLQWDSGAASRPYFGNALDMVDKFALKNRSFDWPGSHIYHIIPYFSAKKGNFSFKTYIYFRHELSERLGFASNDHIYLQDHSPLLPGTDRDDQVYVMKDYSSYGLRLLSSYKTGKTNRIAVTYFLRNESAKEEQRFRYMTDNAAIDAYFNDDPYKTMEMNVRYITLAIQDEVEPSKMIKFSAGLSYDAQKITSHKKRYSNLLYRDSYIIKEDSTFWGTRDSFNPVLGLIFKPMDEQLLLKASFAMKARFPTMAEISIVDGYSVPDLTIQPERIYNVNAGLQFQLWKDFISLSSQYFCNIIDDRIALLGDILLVNVDRAMSQGVENAVTAEAENLLKIFDVTLKFSYTFTHARDDSPVMEEDIYKGKYFEFVPEHQIALELGIRLFTGTSMNFWGTYLESQKAYVMAAAPLPASPFSRYFFRTVNLHNPIQFNIVISQKILGSIDIYFKLSNITDDYNSDPLNPGPGRMWYIGARAEL